MLERYSRFIPHESEVKIALVKLLHKQQAYEWGEEQQAALVEALFIARPDFSRPFKVQSDGSDYTIGAVLTQEGEDGEHTIVHIS